MTLSITRTPGARAFGAGLFVLLGVVASGRAGVTVSQPFEGVRHTHRTQILPRELSIHLVEIDLDTPGLSFRMTPSNGSAPGENTVQTTLDYLRLEDAQVAVNASFYLLGSRNVPALSSSYAVSRGLVASDGDVYSPFGERDSAANNNPDNSRPWPVLNLSADNVASILDRALPYDDSSDVTPDVPLFNAVSGSGRIVTNGVNTSAGHVTFGVPTTLQPRTAAGITADHRLVLFTVDGRQPGFSAGMNLSEVADLLIQYGVTDAVNLDGGGSTTLAFGDSRRARVVNSPSDGSPRRVATSLAVHTGASTEEVDLMVYSDFYGGDPGTFRLRRGFSPSTAGIDAAASAVEVTAEQSFIRGWSQKLTLANDPAAGSDEHPDGGWFVRHPSGVTASRDQNTPRPTTGFVGFWAMTTTPGLEIAIALDDSDDTTADRGLRRALVADGQWRLYEWNLEDDTQWEGWIDGDGVIDTADFTLDSIQLFGPERDAVVYLDAVAHNAHGSLALLIPEPTTLVLLAPLGALVGVGRRNRCA